ncbi:cobalamin biosynthesis protein CobG [Marinobacter bohaiensis]|uniref:cobalamin biosynthesis protein CobG n=1 Tax=Marinobacter bohaiensis TaxID=2201898 RepID=UPI000DAE22C3|nr:cobalamin biosynthesis protein CobG [Marinobacter bohaiensis]
MVAEARIKGWCPGGWRPMASGDGLLVRVRPFHGRLTRDQALALCDAADTYGSGQIQLTNRANLQLRGVSESDWPALLEALAGHELVDPDQEAESRRNLILAPDWEPGDDTDRAGDAFIEQMAKLPALPDKVGFALDAGPAPILADTSADFRLERTAEGALMVRADGYARGLPVPDVTEAVTQLIALAQWFVDSGGAAAGRMCRHRAPLPDWARPTVSPAPARTPLALGAYPAGQVYGLPFGRTQTTELRAALAPASVTGVRVTPWRRLLVEGVEPGLIPGLLSDHRDPRLSVDACPGAPACEQAHVATEALAERLSGRVRGNLHVSGCDKGCARRQPAEVCLRGREGRFDVILNGRADGEPAAVGLSEDDVIEYLENRNASRL